MKVRLREVGYRPEDIELSKFLDPNNWHPRISMSASGVLDLMPRRNDG